MISYEFKAIGTLWWIRIESINSNESSIIFERILNIAEEFESNYSRFKSSSLISELNSKGYLNNPSIELLKIINLSEELRVQSQGFFNIGVGKILNEVGYDANYSFKSKKKLSKIEGSVFTEISKDRLEIKEKSNIDLGGIGKGVLVDKISEFLRSKGIKYFGINAGGDIYVTSNSEEPYEFFLEDPSNPSLFIGKIKIKNQAIAASSNTYRKWGGKNRLKLRWHIINPLDSQNKLFKLIKRNDSPKVVGVFTLAENATIADALSTAIFVSPESIYKSISSFYNLEYLVIFENGIYTKSSGYPAELFINKDQ